VPRSSADSSSKVIDSPGDLAYNRAMSIHLRPDQEAHLREIAVRSGRDPSQLAQEAVDRLFEREDRRAMLLAELDEAEESIARGEGLEITAASMRELATAVKQRGRGRLANGDAGESASR
jgi:predicted transcriptional regulator